MATDGSLRIAFPYSARDHAAALSETRGGRFVRRWIRGCAAFMGVASAGMTALGVAVFGTPLLEMLAQTGPVMALAAGWWAAPALLQRFQRWWILRENGPDARQEVRVFGRDGFVPSSQWSEPVPWPGVQRAVETSNYFLIHATSDGPSYVPKSAMTAGQIETARGLLADAFRARPRDLKSYRVGTSVSR